ncbi:hypothetical protein [Aequorivita echinoideorum]|uniref:NlpE N-terminal domain-containing protein n=1 Tax=Aequorivita echinoideorum TaxID=1549647 RepID=A0ABS5S5T3_9FLAO|nr:hypothetical protein [Aequorivita echinoideorum]MBT0608572.1 hypothetical protein [Aequorivita echinoideorum]
MRNKIIIILSFIIMFSCGNDDCENIFPLIPQISISIEDIDGNSLLGEENIYKPSEITLTRGNQNIQLIFEETEGKIILYLDYTDMESGQDYLLKLNDVETDILNLTICVNKGECSDTLVVEKFLLNGEEIIKNAESFRYIIQK